jgi:DNA repair exonuclease SbcCD ATPase subunit
MNLTNKNKCPICGTEYVKNQQKCKKCYWNLSLSSPKKNYSVNQVIIYAENWAKNAYRKANDYLKQRNQLRKTMDESHNLKQEISELKQEINELKEQIHKLLIIQENQSSNLKNEIISEVKELIRQSLKSDNSNQQLNIIQTDFIQEQSSSDKSNFSSKTLSEELDEYEQHIIDLYYNNPDFLTIVKKVTPTKKSLEDIYLNRATEIIFQESNQSDYLIAGWDNIAHYLVPNIELKINTNSKTVKTIFDLKNYQEFYKTFQVIKPAKVYECSNNQWQLLTKGILQFQ